MFFLPTLLGAAGAGANILGDFLGASAREEAASANYWIERQNARIQKQQTVAALGIESLRNRAELNNARVNALLAAGDARARERNAARLRQFAEARTDQSREAIRRQIHSFEAMQSSQMAATAGSGREISGSALDVMAETAGQMQLALQDMVNDAEFERVETMNQATIEQYGASQQLLAARAGRSSARSAFQINRAANRLGRMSADMNMHSAFFGAQMNLMSGQDAAAGQRLSGIGGIFSGAAGLAGNIFG